MEGNTDPVVSDPDLQALSLAWGDFDSQFVSRLLAETDLKEAFIEAHTLKPEVTHSVEGSKLCKREVSSSQTQGGSVLLPNVDPANFAEDAMRSLFQQYHSSCILPQMEFLRTGSDVMWSQIGNQFSSVFVQLLSSATVG